MYVQGLSDPQSLADLQILSFTNWFRKTCNVEGKAGKLKQPCKLIGCLYLLEKDL